MDRRRLPLNALRAFEAVAHHGSFTAAAAALNISQSALSRHVIGLEESIGRKLFERGHKAITLTDDGRALLAGVARGFDRIEQTLAEICAPAGERQRRLRVNLPPSFAMKLTVPLLTDFRRSFPDVVLDISTPYGGPSGEFDVAVVYARPSVDDWITDLLWEERPTILCHPDLVGELPADIPSFVAANEIVHVKIVDTEPYHTWQRFMRQNGFADISVARGLTFDSASLAVQYALSGQGLALVDPVLFRDDIDSGRLVAPVEAEHYEGFGYYLKIDAEGLADPLISAFRSWLISHFRNRNGNDGAKPVLRVVRSDPDLSTVMEENKHDRTENQ
ncbi:MAG: transcriptional regulator [Devosia sp.]|uniref:LysR substrate-binding domain-containing protein n=1 Tax=Devosia sp. TaxID=1871048 RepID=UPI0026251C7D|nr:LysR substrate-binding domain-containing protein [Devosia sp.]MDB5531374.1 transcriptional regulator [Devosia sp.]